MKRAPNILDHFTQGGSMKTLLINILSHVFKWVTLGNLGMSGTALCLYQHFESVQIQSSLREYQKEASGELDRLWKTRLPQTDTFVPLRHLSLRD